jgi:hypothetical protein
LGSKARLPFIKSLLPEKTIAKKFSTVWNPALCEFAQATERLKVISDYHFGEQNPPQVFELRFFVLDSYQLRK